MMYLSLCGYFDCGLRLWSEVSTFEVVFGLRSYHGLVVGDMSYYLGALLSPNNELNDGMLIVVDQLH